MLAIRSQTGSVEIYYRTKNAWPLPSVQLVAAQHEKRRAKKIKKARLIAVLLKIFFVRRLSRCAPTTQRIERLEEAKNV